MKDFLNFSFDGAHPNSTFPCPCRKCLNIIQKKRDVHNDLLHHGMDLTYTHWIYHGEQSDEGSMSEDSDNEDAVDDGVGVCDMLNTLIRGTHMGSTADHGEEARLGGPVLYRWMYPIERYLRTLKGYVRNKAHPEGSIAEGYILEECMTFCSRFVDGMPIKLSQAERHEDGGTDQPPTVISIMSTVDYSKKGFVCESLSLAEINQMRHFIITNCEETAPWIDEHLEELTRNNSLNPQKQHKEEFVGWFERRITELHNDGKVSNLIYALAKGPDHRARVYNHTVLNRYFFRNSYIEKDLSTQNSGVIVKGDESTCNIDYYGLIKKIIFLEFPPDKEVVLFQCEWFDVPPSNRTQSRGHKKDKYGIIDLETTLVRFKDDPYILGTQAQQVFYVRDVKNPDWANVIKMNPRNLFAPSAINGVALDEADEGEADILDVGVAEITVPDIPKEITSWCRNDVEDPALMFQSSKI